MLRDLPRDINEQSVIDIESLAGKRNQAGEHGHSKKYVMNVLMLVWALSVGDAIRSAARLDVHKSSVNLTLHAECQSSREAS